MSVESYTLCAEDNSFVEWTDAAVLPTQMSKISAKGHEEKENYQNYQSFPCRY